MGEISFFGEALDVLTNTLNKFIGYEVLLDIVGFVGAEIWEVF